MKLRIDLDQDGVELFLGSLESRIMHVIWDSSNQKGVTAQHVWHQLGVTDISLSSVNETLSRLAKKKLLKRSKNGKPYRKVYPWYYTPIYKTPESLIAYYTSQIVTRFTELNII